MFDEKTRGKKSRETVSLRNTQNTYYQDKDTADEQCVKKEHMCAYQPQKQQSQKKGGAYHQLGRSSRNLNN
jgi:hypothetical protein